ncbi:hypothetical protein SO802_006028 [Lithocarpus litseifolius]|uniref:Uncharacterized protein n=1 Tax=Lithocarpus litseifolius TaxID=425828 RepID=A0AAW2DJS4_9ROSI
MASFSSRKKRERSSTPSEGEGSSTRSAPGEVQEVVDRLAFPLRDPWYIPSLFFPQVFSGQPGFTSSTQTPDPREILDLQISEAIPIFFDFVPKKISSWSSWVDKELSDGFKDAKGLRHLVRRWSPSLHIFFFFVGELTITLEDVVNNFLLPMFGEKNPFDISLSETSERSEGQEDKHPMMAEVITQAHEEALPQGSGTKEPELAITKEAKGLAPNVQTIEAQTRIPQTIQRPESPPVLEGGDITMKEAPEMTVLDLSSGLPIFLSRFDSLEFNSLPISQFHLFGPPFANFLGGVFLANILMELLCVVLISLMDSFLNSLSEGRLLEWRGVVQDLIKAKLNLSFLLEYLRSLAHTLFQRKASKNLDTEIVIAEEALARAHKVL